MGLFDWFSSQSANVTVGEDKVWLTRSAKYNGIQRAVSQLLAEPKGPDAVILVAHFADCLHELRQIVEPSGRAVTAVSAADLTNARPAQMSLGESHSIHILVGERHPLPSHDAAVVEFARSLPCRSRIVFHASLDEPLMQAFAGQWVETMLKRLGMAEDEAIESRMVARRIAEAQKKLASECDGDLPADSCLEWMERNCPRFLRGG